MSHYYKSRRELERLADEFGLKLIGPTMKGHLKWLHPPTGKTIITISAVKHHRALDNTRRSIKRMLAGVSDGHHTSAAD